MMNKLEERINDKPEEQARIVDVFEVMNWILFVNQNITSVIRFFSGPVNSPSGGLTEWI